MPDAYGVTGYYRDDDGERREVGETVPADDAVEAAGWMHNHIENELGGEPVGDIEVFPPGADEPILFPT